MSHLLVWCSIQKKVPTYDVMYHNHNIGYVWCALCKGNKETIEDLFVNYHFKKQVRSICSTLLG